MRLFGVLSGPTVMFQDVSPVKVEFTVKLPVAVLLSVVPGGVINVAFTIQVVSADAYVAKPARSSIAPLFQDSRFRCLVRYLVTHRILRV